MKVSELHGRWRALLTQNGAEACVREVEKDLVLASEGELEVCAKAFRRFVEFLDVDSAQALLAALEGAPKSEAVTRFTSEPIEAACREKERLASELSQRGERTKAIKSAQQEQERLLARIDELAEERRRLERQLAERGVEP